MTKTLGLNSNNDIYLGADGNIVMLSGIEAVAGACATISRSQLGEMVLTKTQGIPNFSTIWSGVPNTSIWQSYLRKSLQNVSGVQEVVNIGLSIESGVLSYTATIRTQFGTTQING